MLKIRTARPEDLPALTEIYNYEVLHGVATFDLHPRTLEERRVWLEAHNVDNHPLLTAELDGIVTGYASLSPYREKEAYRSTVELSVYVAQEARGRGVATALMGEVLALARKDEGTHTVVSVITAGNAASVRLHEKFGFTYCGTLPAVGKKFGRYLDTVYYSLIV